MFAVPGWSVSSSLLKAQIAPAKGDGESKSSKKRKRGKDKDNAVNGENVAELWQQQFEGKRAPVSKQQAKAKEALEARKKQKTVEEVAAKPDTTPVTKVEAQTSATDSKDSVVVAKEESRKDKKNKKKNKGQSTDGGEKNGSSTSSAASAVAATAPPAVPVLPPATKLTPMQSAMRQKLISARFRHLNETLYTAPSGTSLDLFANNPEMFDDYHAGFRQQVQVWPENPVDIFIATLQQRGAIKPKYNPRDRKRKPDSASSDAIQVLPRTHGTAIIADLGCGDARLASTLNSTNMSTKHNLKIMSFDLQSPSPHVTKADIAALPLEDGSVDIAIFCLALMGTNWIDFIEEAYRILHWKGELWVAEIKSRFGRIGGKGPRVVAHSVGSKRKEKMGRKALEEAKAKATEKEEEATLATVVDGADPEGRNVETDVSGFVEVLRRRGFVLKDADKSVDLGNKMFVRMEFIKAANPVVGKNVKKEEPVAAAAGEGDDKDREQRRRPKKFIDEKTKEIPVADEAKVLKPCLYKIR